MKKSKTIGGFRNLLSFNNVKTIKGEKLGYRTAILYLSPSDESGVANLCKFASKSCRELCLYNSGMSLMFPKINIARKKKTLLLIQDPDGFWKFVDDEIHNLRGWCWNKNLTPAVRLNGTSDILNEQIIVMMNKNSDIQFYDYTKDITRISNYVSGKLPHNYHLTYSHSEGRLKESMWCLNNKVNVAVVFDTKKSKSLPEKWNGYTVVDGDESDLRFLDEPVNGAGVVIGLRAKGKARKVISRAGGFVNPSV